MPLTGPRVECAMELGARHASACMSHRPRAGTSRRFVGPQFDNRHRQYGEKNHALVLPRRFPSGNVEQNPVALGGYEPDATARIHGRAGIAQCEAAAISGFIAMRATAQKLAGLRDEIGSLHAQTASLKNQTTAIQTETASLLIEISNCENAAAMLNDEIADLRSQTMMTEIYSLQSENFSLGNQLDVTNKDKQLLEKMARQTGFIL